MIEAVNRSEASGFTLIELLVTITIAAILLTIALTSMTDLILNQRVRPAASDVPTAMIFARSDALTRAVNVDVIPVTAGGTQDWKNGWSVKLGATELRNHAALNEQLSAMTGTNVTYQSDGHVIAAPGPIIVRVTTNPKVTARCVVIGLSGRASMVVDTDGVPSNGCN